MPPKKEPEKDKAKSATPRPRRQDVPPPPPPSNPTTPSRARSSTAGTPSRTPTHFTRSHANFADQALGGSAMTGTSGASAAVRASGRSVLSFGPARSVSTKDNAITGGAVFPGASGTVNEFYRKRVFVMYG